VPQIALHIRLEAALGASNMLTVLLPNPFTQRHRVEAADLINESTESTSMSALTAFIADPEAGGRASHGQLPSFSSSSARGLQTVAGKPAPQVGQDAAREIQIAREMDHLLGIDLG
jgi:hypothetical protein